MINNVNASKHAVGQDSETKSTEHCPKYKQSTITQIHLENRPNIKTNIRCYKASH